METSSRHFLGFGGFGGAGGALTTSKVWVILVAGDTVAVPGWSARSSHVPEARKLTRPDELTEQAAFFFGGGGATEYATGRPRLLTAFAWYVFFATAGSGGTVRNESSCVHFDATTS
jgi:hypothetical protein